MIISDTIAFIQNHSELNFRLLFEESQLSVYFKLNPKTVHVTLVNMN